MILIGNTAVQLVVFAIPVLAVWTILYYGFNNLMKMLAAWLIARTVYVDYMKAARKNASQLRQMRYETEIGRLSVTINYVKVDKDLNSKAVE